jgi:hypothetical protein
MLVRTQSRDSPRTIKSILPITWHYIFARQLPRSKQNQRLISREHARTVEDGSDTALHNIGMYQYLTIDLEPQLYSRNRFEGSSFEKKKHGARRIIIYFNEFQMILDTIKKEIDLCHRLIQEHGLLGELHNEKIKSQEDEVQKPKIKLGYPKGR